MFEVCRSRFPPTEGDQVAILPGNLALSGKTGHNVITLTATDSSGNSSSDTLAFDVL